MKTETAKLLQKKRKQVLEYWMNKQLSDASLREDLMSSQELNEQSVELLDALLKAITDKNMGDIQSPEFDHLKEILSGISILRAKQGFSPRETGLFVFSLKDALQQVLADEIKDDPASLYQAS